MAALPEVHEWTRHLSRSEAPHPDQIEAAVSIARRIAQPGGTSLVDAATEFVTTVVQDRVVLNALIDMVAGLSSASAGNASGSTTNSTFGARQVPNNRPFSVHANVQCNGCNMAPIRGVRYRATTRDDFDLCETCYAIEERRENIDTFDALKYVWESEFGDMCVPPPPLVLGDRGVRVAFLQKLLTDLGYMNASMYRFRIGGFGPNTRAGIEQFQRERSLEIAGEPGVYDALTAAYLASVLEAQEVGGAPEAGGEEGGSGEATQATA